jgi:hypothetical protein
MIQGHPYILCFGRDHLLLQTRSKLLQQAGLPTRPALHRVAAERGLLRGEISLLVLCHSLAGSDVQHIAAFHRSLASPAIILSLVRGDWRPWLAGTEIFETRNGPAAFIDRVSALLAVSSNTRLIA